MKWIACFLLCTGSLIVNAQDAVPADVFYAKMQSGKTQVLDVRTMAEYNTGFLPGSLQADWLNRKEFTERVAYLDKDKPVLVCCASGVRSADAAAWLRKNGFTDVSNLSGGLIAWKKAGRSLEKKEGNGQSGFTVDAFTKRVQANELVLVDIGASWCPPCRKMAPVIENIRKEFPSMHFVMVEAGVDTDIMTAVNADTLPTFIIYRKGKEVWRKTGLATAAEFRKNLAK